MTDTKLRLKVGSHEFEAEGPEEVVAKYLAIWRDAISRATPEAEPESVTPTAPPAESPPPSDLQRIAEAVLPPEEGGIPKERLARLIVFDERRGIYRLRVIPTGDNAVGDAVLVLLYGALRLKDEDEMLATKVVAALQSSGMNVDRIDRDAAMHMRERWITRYGVGKGGRYRLTSTGMTRARDVAQALLGQFGG